MMNARFAFGEGRVLIVNESEDSGGNCVGTRDNLSSPPTQFIKYSVRLHVVTMRFAVYFVGLYNICMAEAVWLLSAPGELWSAPAHHINSGEWRPRA